MQEGDATLRLQWFRAVLNEQQAGTEGKRPITVRPSSLQVDRETDRLEQALSDLATSRNAASERRSLMTSVQIVDGWYRTAGLGDYVMPGEDDARRPSLSELAYQLLDWKRRDSSAQE